MSRSSYPSVRSVRVSLLLVLSCFILLGDCVRAPTLPVAVTADKTTVKAKAPVPERVLTLDDIRSKLWRSERTFHFETSTIEERKLVADIVEALLRGAHSGEAPLAQLAKQASGIGLRLEVWLVEKRRYWALTEAEEDRRGAGAYLFRVGKQAKKRPQVLLQAPHAFFDVGTGELALRMFLANRPRVVGFFTNTLHRYWDESGDYQKRERNPADLCHRMDHVFQHATDSAARTIGDLVVVQLHGFRNSKRRPDAIVSSGDPGGSSPLVQRIARGLRPVLGNVQRFPEDFDELGGTTNAQGILLSSSRRAHFVHLEMSKRVRERLQRKPELLMRMADTLFDSALEPSDDPPDNPPGSPR